MKYYLRRKEDYIRMVMTELTDDEIHMVLLEVLYSITEADIFGWFRHCGYVEIKIDSLFYIAKIKPVLKKYTS
jgi:hypothetical protein